LVGKGGNRFEREENVPNSMAWVGEGGGG